MKTKTKMAQSIKWTWKDKSRAPRKRKVNPQAAGELIESLRKEGNGLIQPSVIVDAATNENSPIHNWFTWDDTAAARKFREEEARLLLRSLQPIHVVVEIDKGKAVEAKPAVTYVHVRETVIDQEGVGDTVSGYVTVNDAMDRSDYREQVMAEAASLLMGIRRRFEFLEKYSKELAEVFKAIDTLSATRAAQE